MYLRKSATLFSLCFEFYPHTLHQAEPTCGMGNVHLSEPMGINIHMGTLRLREAWKTAQGNTRIKAESELEPRSPKTQ